MSLDQDQKRSWTALSGDKAGWTAAQLATQQLDHDWTDAQVRALHGLVAKAREAGKTFLTVTREDFEHPVVTPLMEELVLELKQGPGMLFLRGLPLEGFSKDDLRLLFVGLGRFFGSPVSQSRYGDMLGDVTEQKDRVASQRGYVVAKALPFHTDHAEIIGLFCIERAKTGGENVFVSSIALYDLIKREHPEYIPILERGFRMWLFDEQRLGGDTVTPHRVPIFSEKDGFKTCFMSIDSAIPTANAIGEPLTPEEEAAVAFVIEARQRPELGFVRQLDAGDCVMFNNYEVLHSRMPFEPWDDPARPRHLLRLWLQDSPERPMIPAMPLFRYQNASGRQGIDAAPDGQLEKMNEAAANNPVSKAVLEGLKEFT